MPVLARMRLLVGRDCSSASCHGSCAVVGGSGLYGVVGLLSVSAYWQASSVCGFQAVCNTCDVVRAAASVISYVYPLYRQHHRS